jgi:Tfp pilus assembly protein PilO
MSLRERAIIGCVGITVVVVLLWFAVLAPKRHEATDLGARVSEAEQTRNDAVARAVAGDAAKATYRRDYATVARLGKAVPTQDDVPSLVYQVENVARAAKVDLRAIHGEPASAAAPAATPATTAPGGVAPLAVLFTLEGSYHNVRRALDALGRLSRVKGKHPAISGRLLTIDTIKISPGRKGLPQIKADLVGKAYVAAMPASLGTAAPAATASAPAITPAAQVTP